MISLADSQSVSLTDSDRLMLPASSPIQACPSCDALIDITEHEPLDRMTCSFCGGAMKVHGQVDHYRIIDVAGRGGMGVVYKAYDAMLDRHVALKLLRKAHSDQASLIAQLENEAAITASVSHPNVVRVFSTGTDRGRFFIAMELVEAGSLDELIQLQGRVAEVQALEVGLQIARGLRAAQQHGLIHRDVKPGNILFADAATAKIVDFGLAVFMGQEKSALGEIWGTPYYLAPEKLDSMPEDFRSDIYSLGASLFHAIAGRPPFEAETATLVALKHLKSQPVSIATFAPWVSGATAFVINKTLQKDPGQRYQSYDELIGHLEYAIEELQNAAVQNQPRARMVLETEEDKKRSGWLVAGMLVACMVLLGGFLLFRNKAVSDRAESASARRDAASRTVAPVASDRARALSGFPFPTELAWLAAGDARAAKGFADAARGKNLSAANRAWAPLLEGAADLAAGRPEEARAAFVKARSAAHSVSEPALRSFFRETTASMISSEPIPVSIAERLDGASHRALTLLLAGLKDWNLGRTEDGIALLRKFRSSKPASDAAWIEELKPLATSFIEKATAFQMALERFEQAKTPTARMQAAEAIRGVKGPLAVRAKQALEPFAAEFAAFEAGSKLLPAPGIYTLVNRASGKALDGAMKQKDGRFNVLQWTGTGRPNQRWQLVPNGDGAFRFVLQHSGLSLDLPNSESADGVSISQWPANDSDAQRWVLESAGGGFWRIVSASSGKVLAVHSRSVEDGADVIQWESSGGGDQQWKFVPEDQPGDEWRVHSLGAHPLGIEVTRDRAGDRFEVKAAGADYWMTQDSGAFVAREVTGDFEISARAVVSGAAHEWAKAGLMLRRSVDPGARNVMLAVSNAHSLTRQIRSASGAETTSTKAAGLTGPRWLRLVRTGDRIETFQSIDGAKWAPLGTETLQNLPHKVWVGMAASSHIEGGRMTAVFEKVKLTGR